MSAYTPQRCEVLVLTFAEAHGVSAQDAYKLLDQLETLMRWREGRAEMRGFRRGANVDRRRRVWRNGDGPTTSIA